MRKNESLEKQKAKPGLWDLAGGVIAVIDLAGAAAFLLVCVFVQGIHNVLTAGFACGVLLLVGLIALLVCRKRMTTRLWRGMLIAGVAANGAAVLFLAGFFVLVFLAIARD